MKKINQARNIIDNLFYDDKAITQWQWVLFHEILSETEELIKNNIIKKESKNKSYKEKMKEKVAKAKTK